MSAYVSLFVMSLSAIFFVVDPIGIVPLFLTMTAGDPPEKARRTARRACAVAGGLMLFFALCGNVLFKVFGVSLGAFRVAGGVLLLITALDMLRARSSATRTTPSEEQDGIAKEDVALVPLAMPLLAGPGAIATVMVLMARAGDDLAAMALVLASVAITFAASYFVLRGAGLVQRALRASGVAVLERVMGLILAAIAVQFIADGVKELWRG
ncbi:MarC family protein [Sorangium sp. So ce1036]|uniref:MarC family protein n=1 Tax=Sorangium sp. So ce1036 TaxID=3133328 RepID=UPI003F038FC2